MLDLRDIQGNILRGYAKFTHARFMFFGIPAPAAGRGLLEALLPLVTRAEWGERPAGATNIALSFAGLRALALPADSLASFPVPFQVGMRARAASLGDIGDSAPEHWDLPWRDQGVHVVIAAYAATEEARARHCREVLAKVPPGIEVLSPAQDAATLMSIEGESDRIEHFGFVDGLSNPLIKGAPEGRKGRQSLVGNPDDAGGFRPVAAGEFILGHRDEGGEVVTPVPHLLVRNGSFLVVRKLHQQVARFRQYVAEQARLLSAAAPGVDQGYIAAKMMGRWPNGSPLVRHERNPAPADLRNDFTYAGDPDGALCPLGAHIRRANPRDSLGFGGRMVDRRRLVRRGIAYGKFLPPGEPDDQQPRGIMFLAFNADFERQFEFVQQQWLNYGDDFQQSNEADPIAGSQSGHGRMIIEGDERAGRVPLICRNIPSFVTTKGGDYFFAPSLTALRMMAANEVRVA